jgi:hypothetical protein
MRLLGEEKELCRKTKSINSLAKANASQTHANLISCSTSKISFRDLCDEDKARIGNLVKEIAK